MGDMNSSSLCININCAPRTVSTIESIGGVRGFKNKFRLILSSGVWEFVRSAEHFNFSHNFRVLVRDFFVAPRHVGMRLTFYLPAIFFI